MLPDANTRCSTCTYLSFLGMLETVCRGVPAQHIYAYEGSQAATTNNQATRIIDCFFQHSLYSLLVVEPCRMVHIANGHPAALDKMHSQHLQKTSLPFMAIIKQEAASRTASKTGCQAWAKRAASGATNASAELCDGGVLVFVIRGTATPFEWTLGKTGCCMYPPAAVGTGNALSTSKSSTAVHFPNLSLHIRNTVFHQGTSVRDGTVYTWVSGLWQLSRCTHSTLHTLLSAKDKHHVRHSVPWMPVFSNRGALLSVVSACSTAVEPPTSWPAPWHQCATLHCSR